MMLAVDPGLRWVGWSLWDEPSRSMLACGVAKGDQAGRGPSAWRQAAEAVYRDLRWATDNAPSGLPFFGYPDEFDELRVEVMASYANRAATVSADLFELSGVVGAIASRWPGRIVALKPSEWKGQLPKDVTIARSLSRMQEYERQMYERAREQEYHATRVAPTPPVEPDAWRAEPYLAALGPQEADLATSCLLGDDAIPVRSYARQRGLGEYEAQMLAWTTRAKLALLLDPDADLSRVARRYPPSKALIASVRAWAASRSAAVPPTPAAPTP